MPCRLLYRSSWVIFQWSTIFPASITCTFAERHTWQPDRALPPLPSFRRFSTTTASSGTAGREPWRIWEWLAPMPCRREPRKHKVRMPMPPASGRSPPTRISSPSGKMPTLTSPSSRKPKRSTRSSDSCFLVPPNCLNSLFPFRTLNNRHSRGHDSPKGSLSSVSVQEPAAALRNSLADWHLCGSYCIVRTTKYIRMFLKEHCGNLLRYGLMWGRVSDPSRRPRCIGPLAFASARRCQTANLRHNHGGAVHRIVLDRDQRLVRLIQRKHCHFRPQSNLRGQREKVAGVGAGHVGHAAQLAFAPQQAVVIELRHAVQVNCVDGDHTALSQAAQRGDHDVSARGECDGAVEFQRRLLGLTSHPGRAQHRRQLAVRLPARRNIHVTLPRPQDRDRQMRGCTEPKQSDALAEFDSRHTQAAEANDSGTEKRGGVQIVKRCGQRKNEVGAGQR